MSVRRGTYALFVSLDKDEEVAVGALGKHLFKAGLYCYVGSAMGGLDQRLKRHLSHQKTLRWHIDYLSVRCASAEAWESYPDYIPECRLAEIAEECGGVPEMDGFGCSDCRCRTHLFRVTRAQKEAIISQARLSFHGKSAPIPT